jgi:DNA modification methylase
MDVQYLNPKVLKPYPLNAKTHPPDQIEKIIRSINLSGFDQPIVVNKEGKDLVLIKGHGRLLASLQMALKEVPVIVLELPKLIADQARLMDNKSAESDYDLEILIKELSKFESLELPDTGYSEDEMSKLIMQLEDQLDSLIETDSFDEDKENEIPEETEVETKVKTGDIWQLGNHYLLCGDCTIESNVRELLGDRKVDMVFTSPPYNANQKQGTSSYGKSDREAYDKPFYSDYKDNLSSEEYISFCLQSLKTIELIGHNKTVILWNVCYNSNSRNEYGKIVFNESNPYPVQETIIWDKGVGMNIVSTNILSRTCEFVFLLSKTSKYYTNQNKEVYWNVWRISNRDGDNMQNGHGASFPVALPTEGINKFSPDNAIIFDPFLGSGTTIIASEKTNRVCYGTEISEKYCDVIIKRWENLTGKEAVLIRNIN